MRVLASFRCFSPPGDIPQNRDLVPSLTQNDRQRCCTEQSVSVYRAGTGHVHREEQGCTHWEAGGQGIYTTVRSQQGTWGVYGPPTIHRRGLIASLLPSLNLPERAESTHPAPQKRPKERVLHIQQVYRRGYCTYSRCTGRLPHLLMYLGGYRTYWCTPGGQPASKTVTREVNPPQRLLPGRSPCFKDCSVVTRLKDC